MQALIDCNNFFVSCERIFQPHLRNIPVVVLSNNDGCIIARSNEAKSLGIKMGEPLFKAKEIIERNNVRVFSSNYRLYGDISNRVMEILKDCGEKIYIYSIDEAFIDVSRVNNKQQFAMDLRNKISKWLGITVSIGIGSTKTLAKVANNIAKKKPKLNGILVLDNEQYIRRALEITDVGDIWGVGRAFERTLKLHNINKAIELINLPDQFIRKNFNIVALRTVYELKGMNAVELSQNIDLRKSISIGRSFPERLMEFEDINKALKSYIRRASEKLRSKSLVCRYMIVYLTTSPFGENRYSNSQGSSLENATNYTPDLLKLGERLLKNIFKPGYSYKKCGVIFSELAEATGHRSNLFDERDLIKEKKLMDAFDSLNKRMGKNTIRFASENFNASFKGKSDNISNHYTDDWDEILQL